MHIWQNSEQKTSFKLFSLQQKHMLQEAVSLSYLRKDAFWSVSKALVKIDGNQSMFSSPLLYILTENQAALPGLPGETKSRSIAADLWIISRWPRL